MATDQKYEILSFVFGLTNELHESSGIHRATRGVEENFARARMAGEEVKADRNDFAHVTACVSAAPLDKFGSDRIGMRIARFADVVEKEFQWLLHFHQHKSKVVVLWRIGHPLPQFA